MLDAPEVVLSSGQGVPGLPVSEAEAAWREMIARGNVLAFELSASIEEASGAWLGRLAFELSASMEEVRQRIKT
eukprot:2985336-Rhodomonas_salina.1